jgi:periplasmic protein TonB
VTQRRSAAGRDTISLVISTVIHVGFVAALVVIPSQVRNSYETVNLTVSQSKIKQEAEPEIEPESEIEPEPEPEKTSPKPAPKPKTKEPKSPEPPPEAPPEEAPPPEDAKEAPPVFDLGDNTFATGKGQGASWSLERSEGNTKFAGVAKKDQPSVRDTKVKPAPKGKTGGTGDGYKPVPLKNLSRRPKPRDGPPPPPTYPSEARREGIEGPVVLQVFIDKKGKVRRLRVIKSPSNLLAESAKSAMLKVRWTPPLDKSGTPVDTVIIYSYRFVLDG